MKELTDELARETRGRDARKGKVETPPLLTDDDETALDDAWKGANDNTKTTKPAPKK